MRTYSVITLALALSLGISGSFLSSHSVFAADSAEKTSDPSQVVPEFQGNCAMAVADGHAAEPGSAKYTATFKGKTYYFCSEDAKNKFMKNADANAHSASHNWARSHTDKS